MEKYNKNLGYYYLKQRFENYYFNPSKIKEMDKEFFNVTLSKEEKNELEEDLNLKKIYLSVAYPGLLIGTGTNLKFESIGKEKVKEEDNYNIGINFDYTSGIPFIPGSSIKGVLRSFFPNIDSSIEEKKEITEAKTEIINTLLNRNFSIEELKKITACIFEGYIGKEDKTQSKEATDYLPMFKRDKFIEGRVLINSKTEVLERDYITPHKKILENPVPLEIVKIPPETKIEVYLQLHDIELDGLILKAEEKLNLFREILYITGIGAKTNTGYGHFEEEDSLRLTQTKEREVRRKIEEITKIEKEKEEEKKKEERAKLSPIERWKVEVEEKNIEEKKKDYKKDLDNFTEINDKKIVARYYLELFKEEKSPSKKTKQKIKELNDIVEG